jgi:hypothetical protein
MMNYFKVLGISETAGRDEVKRAYREMAKEWHPDRNNSERAAEVFILVNEAYEYLIDDERRKIHRLQGATSRDASMREARERRYREWVEKHRREARVRATAHASQSYDAFVNSRFERTFIKMDRLYNYLFLTLSIIIVLVPFVVLFRPEEGHDDLDETTLVSMGLTLFLGLLFTRFIWKYLIRSDESE